MRPFDAPMLDGFRARQVFHPMLGNGTLMSIVYAMRDDTGALVAAPAPLAFVCFADSSPLEMKVPLSELYQGWSFDVPPFQFPRDDA